MTNRRAGASTAFRIQKGDRELAGSFEWHAGPADNKTAIRFTSLPGGTIVRIDGRYMAPKFLLFLGAGTVTLLTGLIGTAVSPELGVGLGLGMLAVAFTCHNISSPRA